MKNKKLIGQWMTPRAIALKIESGRAITLAVTVAMAAFALIVSILASPSHAAIARTSAVDYNCEDRLSNLYLAGTFVMPNSGESMNLWIGKPRSEKTEDVWGLVGKAMSRTCEAQCKVTRFERFKKDMQPALMEMDCEGMRLRTMKMPLHVQWVREKKGFDTMVRLGSSIYGMEEAPLRLQVNRYEIVKGSKVAKK